MRGETSRQAGMLFSAQTLSMMAGFVVSLILARWMEPGEMGRFAFCLSVVVIASLFFELGIFSAGARVLALAGSKEQERCALGALVLMATATGTAFSLFMVAAAFPIDLIFKKDVRWLLIPTAVFAFFHPFQLLVEQSCQGLNQIRRLSLFQLLNSWSYLAALIVLALAHTLTARTALVAYLTGIGISSLWALVQLRPNFRGTGPYIKQTLEEARGYGFNIYLARITGTVSVRVDNLVIAYFFANPAPLGLYAVAQKLANPISMLSRSLAITRFRAFAGLNQVPPRISKWNAAAVVIAATGLAVAGPFVLKIAFPNYSEAAPLLVPFAALNLFAALFQPYNMFLSSHGRGAELRNIAVIYTVAGIVSLILVVPRFGITGAAWAGAATMALDYALHLYYYRKFRRTLGRSEP